MPLISDTCTRRSIVPQDGSHGKKGLRASIDDISRTALSAPIQSGFARSDEMVGNLRVRRETRSTNSNAAREGGSLGPKNLTYHCSFQVGAAAQAARMDRKERFKILDLL